MRQHDRAKRHQERQHPDHYFHPTASFREAAGALLVPRRMQGPDEPLNGSVRATQAGFYPQLGA